MGRRGGRQGDAVLGLIALVCGCPLALAYTVPEAGIVLGIVLLALTIGFGRMQPDPGHASVFRRSPQVFTVLSLLASLGVFGVAVNRLVELRDDRESARRAAEEQAAEERARVEQATEASARALAEADRRRAAEQAAALVVARRTPAERAAVILNILSATADAGSSSMIDRVCRARAERDRIPSDARRRSDVHAAIRALRQAEGEALREARESARWGRMVRCCDGTSSPSCECGRRSYRGCCSWHGGMCGCDPLPSEIECGQQPR